MDACPDRPVRRALAVAAALSLGMRVVRTATLAAVLGASVAAFGQPMTPAEYPDTRVDDPQLAERVADLEAALKRISDEARSEPKKPASGMSLKLRGHLLIDAAAFTQDSADKLRHDEQNGLDVPVARIIADGQGAGVMGYKIEFDYVKNTVGDLYLTVADLPLVGNLCVGHMKEPFSIEQLESPKYTLFMERSLARAVHPSFRRIGIMAFDVGPGERGTWAVGLFSDAPGYKSVQGDDFGGAVTMRGTYLPWYDEKSSGRGLLHTAMAYSHREAFGHTTRFRTQPGSRLASFLVDTGDIPADSVDLWNAEAALVYGPFSIQSEYSIGWVDARARPGSEIHGFYVVLSYFLTGENRRYEKSKGVFSQIRPFEDFLPARAAGGGPRAGAGAWELKYRYSYVDAFDDGRLGAEQAGSHAVGVNWYLNPYTRLAAEYLVVSTSPNDGNPDGVLQIFQMRSQIEF
jgi:phosphate-selective porin OprO/OprP